MGTQAKALAKRTTELNRIAKEVLHRKQFTLAPELDDEARALYWLEPWDHKRYLKDEKSRWKKDGNREPIPETPDLRPAIQMYLASFSPSPRAIERWKRGGHITGPHRRIGFLEEGTLFTYREYVRNWHMKLQGWTVNLHILKYADRFGFKDVDINGRVYSVERLLKCPVVPRKESGRYEVNVLLKDPDNVYDPWALRPDRKPSEPES